MPLHSFDVSQLDIPKNIADPKFNKSNPVDLLIGAELFWNLLCVGQINSGRNKPVFQKTQLGWIVSGKMPVSSGSIKATSCNLAIDAQLNNKLSQFWNIEEYNCQTPYSPEERHCEEHFLKTFSRDNNVHFMVKNPVKQNSISRFGEIKKLSDPANWHHVRSKEIPADIISRGRTLNDLLNSKLWWHGSPRLLTDYSEQIKTSNSLVNEQELPERRTTVSNFNIQINDFNIFQYSKYLKQIRVTAYCLRLAYNSTIKNHENRLTGPLNTNEINAATNRLIKIVQAASFSKDLQHLGNNKTICKTSKLLSLNPFLDEDGIISVGGQLRNAQIPYSQKYPIVLSKEHVFNKLLVEHAHVRNLHVGAQGTLAAIRQKYWLLGARSLIRQTIYTCITCYKLRPTGIQPLMGNLPKERVTPSRPFTRCGVDYFGPIIIRENQKRNYKTMKAYGAIFICVATKPVYLGLATDLSTETFLDVMERFRARRRKPECIFSDNGTNFVGANHELRKLYDLFNDDYSKNSIISSMATDNINWQFIPPRAPHFGGIWEAAVKSTKHHLRRVIGKTCLNYKETYRLLVQIEAILNSRSLIPMSNDPNDCSILTPGHFLIENTLASHTEPDISSVTITRLSRWQHIKHQRQHFWSRWSKEYLSQLQPRTKWQKNDGSNLQPGQFVLIEEDNLPPLQWHLGRIETIHPGQDCTSSNFQTSLNKTVYSSPTVIVW